MVCEVGRKGGLREGRKDRRNGRKEEIMLVTWKGMIFGKRRRVGMKK